MSFRLKTIIGVALIEAVLLLFLVITSLDFLSRSNQREIDKRAQTTVEMFATTVKDAVLSTDLASLQSFVEALMTHPGVEYVRIKDQQGILAQGGLLDDQTEDRHTDRSVAEVDDDIYDVASPIIESGHNFGEVQLGLAIDEFGDLISQARERFFLIAGLEMLLVGFFSFMLGKYLTRTLDQLRQASVDIIEGGPGVEIPVSGNDELADTGRAFNTMSRRLAENHEKLNKTLNASNQISILLQESNLRMKAVLKNAVDGIVTIDENGLIEDINPAGCHLFGYLQSQMIGKNLSELLAQPGNNATDSQVHSCLQENKPGMIGSSRALTGLRRDGSSFPIELSVSEMHIGERDLFLGLIRDLSDRKRIESEVDSSRIIHSATIAASLDGLISMDMDGRVLEFSPAAERIFGYTREEILGQMLEDYILPETMRAAHRRGLQHFRNTGEGPVLGKRIEVNGLHKDGREIPLEMAVQPISVADQMLFTAFLRDISDRKENEQQLEQARILAEQGSEAKSRFLATMSHEIRSPLNAVLGSVDLLLDTPLDKEQAVYAHTAKDSGRALLSLINDILDFSKIEAGELVLENTDFAPTEIVDSVFQILAPKAEDKKIDLVSCVYRNVPDTAHGDPTRLRQVLINLVDNALKFSEHGAVSVQLGAKRIGPDQVELVFEVQDDGPGIPGDKQDELFEEFSQVDASHSTKYGGTGLGLAISRRLVDLMSGSMTVHSEEGKGSAFRFTVRAGVCASPALPIFTFAENTRVLLIHPEKRVRELLVAQYRQQRLAAEAAGSVEQATAMSNSGKLFTTVLIDERAINQANTADIQSLRRKLLIEGGTLAAMTSFVGGDIADALSELHVDQLVKKPLTRSVMFSVLGQDASVHRVRSSDIRPPEESAPTNLRLLLAEDSPANQLVAGALLRKAGYQVDIASNGEEAVAAVRNTRYDLVLMDMRMPGMDGLEATREIRALPDPAGCLPIIALTANAQKEDVEQCLKAGMNDFVAKPVNRRRLLDAIARWTAANPAAEQGHAPASPKDDIMLDHHTLTTLAEETSPELVPQMLQVFVTETRERLERLRARPEEEPLETLEDEAHAMKSGAGTFGAPRLHVLARDLEAACRNGDRERSRQLQASLLQLAEETLVEMEHYCRQQSYKATSS